VTDFLGNVVVLLNSGANALGSLALAAIAVMPGWLSATLIAVVTGILLLVAFKYTSNQRALKAVRADMKAQLLALKLFKDSTRVVFRAQGRILWCALKSLVLAVVPLLVVAVPVLLFLGQLALWYQARPLQVGKDEVGITLKLGGGNQYAASTVGLAAPPLETAPLSSALALIVGTVPEVRLDHSDAIKVTEGPFRVVSKREVDWNIAAQENGYHHLVFRINGMPVDKELAVGDGFMRVSTQRPGWDWWEALLNPAEPPFRPDSPVESIKIKYPERSSWTSGTDWWFYYWLVVSMIAALCFRRLLNVHL
jgi:hypothetical protein